jgi:hypothetical protein
MAQRERNGFVKQLQQTASDRAIPIDRLTCRDLPGKNGFELTIESAGQKRIFTVADSESVNDPDPEIELIINQIVANE